MDTTDAFKEFKKIVEDGLMEEEESGKKTRIPSHAYHRKSSWKSSKITSLTDDGHAYRKYGQKEIQNAKHKRNYNRCIYEFDQRCKATKQVQKIEDDPTNIKITYQQYHTCKNMFRPHKIILDSPDVNGTSILLSFESNQLIDNKCIDHQLTPSKEKEQQECLSVLPVSNNLPLRFDYNGSHDLTKLTPFEPVSFASSNWEHGGLIYTWVSSSIYESELTFENMDFNGFPTHVPLC